MSEKKYSKKHEWIQLNGDIAPVGISKHATEMLGDIVFVELSKGDIYIPAGYINGNPFDIRLSFSINNNPWFYDSIYTNHAGIQYKIQTLKYILSDIYVHKYYDEIAGISFTMGLSKEKNISNSYVNEVFHPTMFWPDLIGGGFNFTNPNATQTCGCGSSFAV